MDDSPHRLCFTLLVLCRRLLARGLIGIIIAFKMTFVESIPQKDAIRFCQRWQVREFALFGSALCADFKPESDVDEVVIQDIVSAARLVI